MWCLSTCCCTRDHQQLGQRHRDVTVRFAPISGYHERGAVQWLRGSRHKIQPLLRPPPQTPQVLSDPLAAPRPDCVRTHPALRAAAPGGRVEVGACLLMLYTHGTCIFYIYIIVLLQENNILCVFFFKCRQIPICINLYLVLWLWSGS